jgi:hypothetical protein
MKNTNLTKLDESALVAQFKDYALRTASVLLDSDVGAANRLYDQIEAIDAELRSRGTDARRALLPLLDDQDLRVRYEAAVRLLNVDRQKALLALKEVQRSHRMPVAAEASFALRNLAEGVFKPI